VSTLIERPDRLKLYRFGDLVNLAPAPWLVKGVLRETSVACLFGPRGSCKSFVALSLAGSVATGVPWMGHDVLNSGLVIYVAAEGGGGMVTRARAWSEQHQIHPAKINMQFVTEPFVCQSESEDIDVLIERIHEAIEWQPPDYTDPETGHWYEDATAREWPKLIIIDTLARCFSGDESQAEDMGAFIQGVDRLKIEFNCTVLVVHHSGWDPAHERGSTALGGACDTIYKIETEPDPDPSLKLVCTKMKDSRESDDLILLRREVTVTRRITDDPDEDLRSLVIETEMGDTEARKAHILSLIRQLGPISWSDLHEVSNVPRASFQRAIVELRESSEIVKENNLWRLV
jgi:hypothetical protein